MFHCGISVFTTVVNTRETDGETLWRVTRKVGIGKGALKVSVKLVWCGELLAKHRKWRCGMFRMKKYFITN